MASIGEGAIVRETSVVPPRVVEKAKRISDRVVLWTPQVESLLRRWGKQLSHRSAGHIISEAKFTKRYYLLGIPVTILGAVSGTGTLASFRNCDTTATSSASAIWCQVDQWTRLVMGLLTLFSAILTALFVFLNYGGRAEKHKRSADTYSELAREIETTLRISPLDRPDAVETTHSIRARFDETVKNAPPIPEEYTLSLGYDMSSDARDVRDPRRGRDQAGRNAKRNSRRGGLAPPSADVKTGLDVSPSEKGLAHILLGFSGTDSDSLEDDEDVLDHLESGFAPGRTERLEYERQNTNTEVGPPNFAFGSSILGKRELQFEMARFAYPEEKRSPRDGIFQGEEFGFGEPIGDDPAGEPIFGEVLSPRGSSGALSNSVLGIKSSVLVPSLSRPRGVSDSLRDPGRVSHSAPSAFLETRPSQISARTPTATTVLPLKPEGRNFPSTYAAKNPSPKVSPGRDEKNPDEVAISEPSSSKSNPGEEIK